MGPGLKLSDTAMLIYVYIQSHSKDDIQLREIQHAMGFASRSSALFHLQKLAAAWLCFNSIELYGGTSILNNDAFAKVKNTRRRPSGISGVFNRVPPSTRLG